MVKKLLRVLVVLVIIAVLVAGGAALIKRKKNELAKAPRYGMRPTPVTVATARKGDLQLNRAYLAVVEPVQTSSVAARITAVIDTVNCDEGWRVKKGDLLAKLDSREIRDNLSAVKAQIEQTQAELASNEATVVSLTHSFAYWQREADRDRKLADKHDIPAAQAEGTADRAVEIKGKLDAAKQKSIALGHLIDSLKSRQSQIKTQLSYCTILSPYDGIVTKRLVDPGDLAAPGKPLVVVEDRSGFRLAFDVPQKDLEAVKERAEIEFNVLSDRRTAKISLIYPALDKARMARAEVLLDGEQSSGLSSGQYVPVSVTTQTLKDATLVPTSSLVKDNKGIMHVMVVTGGTLAHPVVDVLGSSGDMAAVTGVNPGDMVVANTFLGWAKLASGMKVEVIK